MFRSQENELWIVLAVLWWLGSLVAWVAAIVVSPSGAGDLSLLTGTALFIGVVSVILRLPALTKDSGTSNFQNHLVWLLSLGANVNWAGALTLRVENPLTLFPIGCFALFVEMWLATYGWTSGRLSWFFGEELHHPENLPIALADESKSKVLRTIQDTRDESGQRIMTGEIYMTWQADEKSQITMIGFVPAFRSPPEMEYETDGTEAVRTLNCTQTGVRFEVKRCSPWEPQETVLAWCAIEPGEADEALEKLDQRFASQHRERTSNPAPLA